MVCLTIFQQNCTDTLSINDAILKPGLYCSSFIDILMFFFAKEALQSSSFFPFLEASFRFKQMFRQCTVFLINL